MNIEPTQAFYPSLVQSFLVIFLSEIADRTFILVLIYSLKMHWLPLVLTSLFAMYSNSSWLHSYSISP